MSRVGMPRAKGIEHVGLCMTRHRRTTLATFRQERSAGAFLRNVLSTAELHDDDDEAKCTLYSCNSGQDNITDFSILSQISTLTVCMPGLA